VRTHHSHDQSIIITVTNLASSSFSPDGRTKHTYQFTYNFNDAHTPSGKTPSIYFKYEISPITVKITRGRGSLVHFLLQLCAIVGGIFTVSGLIAGVTARVLHRFYSGIKLE